MKNTFALVAAGGSGTRMGADVPKQFLKINGIEMIEWSVRKMALTDRFDSIIVCVPEEWTEHTKELFSDLSNIEVISGGNDRTETIDKGLAYIKEMHGINKDTVVLTHDVARPCVTDEMIIKSIESITDKTPCSTVAMKAVDSYALSSSGELVDGYQDRELLYHIQTPQTFSAEKYILLRKKAPDEEYTEATRIFKDGGYGVAIIPGSKKNLKVTGKEDIEIVSMFLSEKRFE